MIKVKSATSKGFEEAKEGDSINYSVPESKTRRGRVGKGVAQTLDTACNQAVILGYTRDEKGKVVKRSPQDHANTIHSSTGGGGNTDQFVVQSGTLRTHKEDKGFREIKDGTCPTIPARAREDGSGQPVIKQGSNIRRLTPRECFRLQNFPDTFDISQVSDTQCYKQAGNSITVRVVQKVIAKIYGVQM